MKSIKVDDLLRLKFESGQMDASTGAVDCLGAVACVYERLGWSTKHVDPVSLDNDSEDICDAAWERVGDEGCCARELGDLILSYPQENTPHVSVVVDTRLGLAFSAFQGHGAMSVRVGTIRQVRGVYRLRREFR